ncbi:MAG: hypothetical protein H6R13_535 [Proteobacteria bacterium]|nr:hypothetical protein [Pseudomonadota bacterium]
MNWIIDDIYSAIVQLKRWQTWLVIGLIGIFAGLAYLLVGFAFRTDALLIFLHRTAGSCRELTNGTIIAMFCGMIFFLFTALLTLGEFQRYFQFKQHAAHHQTRQALTWGIVWGLTAVGIAVGALVFFSSYCR